MAATRAPKQLWELYAAWAANARNTRATGIAGMVPHIVFFGDDPDLTSMAPFARGARVCKGLPRLSPCH